MRALTLSLLLTISGCASFANHDLVDLQRQADSAYAAADYARASQLYTQLAHIMPNDAGIRYQQGNSQARQGQHSSAIDSYRAALLRDPQHARAWHNLLQVQIQQARFTAGEMQGYLNPQTPHAERALQRAQQLLEATE